MGKNAFLNFAYKVLADKSMKRTRFAAKKRDEKKVVYALASVFPSQFKIFVEYNR